MKFYSDPAKYADELDAESASAFRRASSLVKLARALYANGFPTSGDEYVQNAKQVSRAGRDIRNWATQHRAEVGQ